MNDQERPSRLKRGIRARTTRSRIEPRDQRVLRLLAWAGFLTTQQLRIANGYPSLRRTQQRLRALLDHDWLRTELQDQALHRPSIHLLTTQAKEQLVQEGVIDEGYRIPRLPRASKRSHALLVRDVFAALAGGDASLQFRFEDCRFEGDLAREEPFRSIGLIPDAVATVRKRSGEIITWAVEGDAGTETTTTLRKKCQRWRAVLDIWQPPELTLLFVTLREGRRKTLESLAGETGLRSVAVTALTDHIQNLVAALESAHEPHVQSIRAERRTSLAKPRVTVLDSPSPNGAFRPFVGRRVAR